LQKIEQTARRNLFEFRFYKDKLVEIEDEYPTNFSNQEQLFSVLEEYGSEPVLSPSGEILCHCFQTTLRFSPQKIGNYLLRINKTAALRIIFEDIVAIDSRYRFLAEKGNALP